MCYFSYELIRNQVKIQIIMSRKQSHEHKLSYQYQAQANYNPNVKSPYIQLLQSKKKVYGHRFDYNKHNRSFGGQPTSMTQPTYSNQLRQQGSSKASQQISSKPIKSASSEKYPYSHNYSTGIEHKHSSSTNEKVKRVRTEHNEPNSKRPSSSNPYYQNFSVKSNKKPSNNTKQKLHESLNIYSSNNTYESGQIETFPLQDNEEVIDDELQHLEEISYEEDITEEPKKQSSTNYYKNYLEQLVKSRSDYQKYYQNEKYKKMYIDRTGKQNKNGQSTAKKNSRYEYSKAIKDITKDNQINEKNERKQSKIKNNLSFEENTGKNRRKRHLSENKHRYEDPQIIQNQFQIASRMDRLGFNRIGLQNLQINDIDSLVQLIDNCVQQANQYIAYLSQKLEQTKQQLILSKTNIYELEQKLKAKDYQISKHNEYVTKIEKDLQLKTTQLQNLNRKMKEKPKEIENNMEIRNLLQIVEKLNGQNQKLRIQLRQLRNGDREGEIREHRKEKSRDLQAEMNKMEINKGLILQQEQGKASKQFREIQREDLKKMKFIKPKYK